MLQVNRKWLAYLMSSQLLRESARYKFRGNKRS